MPPLQIAGYWPTTYYPGGQWDPDYWPHFPAPAQGDSTGFGRWQPMLVEWPRRDDDDEALILLG